MITPQHHNGIIGIGAGLQSIEHPPHHGIGIAHAGQVSVDGVINRIEALELFVDLGAIGFHLPHPLGKIVEVIRFVWRKLDLLGVVEVEVFFRAIVGEMRRVDSRCEEERFVVFLSQLFDGPIDPLGVGHFLFLVIRNWSPLEEESAGYFLPLVVDAIRKRIGKRDLLAK